MSHVILAQTTSSAIKAALDWKWTRHPDDVNKVVNTKDEVVVLMSSADRARQALKPADKLYLTRHYSFCHGNAEELIRAHKAAGGSVCKAGDL